MACNSSLTWSTFFSPVYSRMLSQFLVRRTLFHRAPIPNEPQSALAGPDWLACRNTAFKFIDSPAAHTVHTACRNEDMT